MCDMSPRSSEDRFRDILEAAERAVQYLGDRDVDAFMQEDAVIDGVAMCLLRIGESVARLRESGTELRGDLPWEAMIGMRNTIAHGYHRLSLRILHRVVRQDLPPVVEHVRNLIEDPDSGGSQKIK